MSNQGNQHNKGPHQDQTFDNLSALCLASWTKNRIPCQGGVGGTDTPNRLFMKGEEISPPPPSPTPLG